MLGGEVFTLEQFDNTKHITSERDGPSLRVVDEWHNITYKANLKGKLYYVIVTSRGSGSWAIESIVAENDPRFVHNHEGEIWMRVTALVAQVLGHHE